MSPPATDEKFAHPPRRLDESGHMAVDDEAPRDLCCFLGWDSLAFVHDSYRCRGDLIRLGHIEGNVEPLLAQDEHASRLDRIG
jgi:hypothetical protein